MLLQFCLTPMFPPTLRPFQACSVAYPKREREGNEKGEERENWRGKGAGGKREERGARKGKWRKSERRGRWERGIHSSALLWRSHKLACLYYTATKPRLLAPYAVAAQISHHRNPLTHRTFDVAHLAAELWLAPPPPKKKDNIIGNEDDSDDTSGGLIKILSHLLCSYSSIFGFSVRGLVNSKGFLP